MRFVFLCLFVLGLAAPFGNCALEPALERQKYGEWKKHASKPYYYRSYFFTRSPEDKEYQYHYGIYYPSRGKRVYLFNPQTKQYWGYWEGNRYSILAKDRRKATIDDIPAEDFPMPGKAPEVPDTIDHLIMIAPPNDFPKLDDDKP